MPTRLTLALALALTLLLEACSEDTRPTGTNTLAPPPKDTPGPNQTQSIYMDPDHPMLVRARATAAQHLGTDPEEVTPVTIQPVHWADGSMGCEQGNMTTHALIEGYRIILSHKGRDIPVHAASPSGPMFVPENCLNDENQGYYPRPDISTICDDELRRQMIFQINATGTRQMNGLITQIQQRLEECRDQKWNPQVKANPEKPGPGMCFPDPQAALGRAASIGDSRVPPSLHQQDNPSMPVQETSGRDSGNSIILYWEDNPARRPTDSAKCWLYHSPGRAWTSN